MLYTNKAVFLSGELSNLTDSENRERIAFLRSTLKLDGYNFTEVLGVSRQSRTYKGSSEVSFMVECFSEETVNTLKRLAFGNYKQESIGILNPDSSFVLVYNDNRVESLGYLQQVPKKSIELLDNYSVIDGTVYSTESLF